MHHIQTWPIVVGKNNGHFCLFCVCVFVDIIFSIQSICFSNCPNKNEDVPWQPTEMPFFLLQAGDPLYCELGAGLRSLEVPLSQVFYFGIIPMPSMGLVYLPNLQTKMSQRWVNMPYMDDMGYIDMDLPPIHEAIVSNESVFSLVVKIESWVGRSKLYRSVTSRSCYWPGFHGSCRCVSLSMVAITSQTRW